MKYNYDILNQGRWPIPLTGNTESRVLKGCFSLLARLQFSLMIVYRIVSKETKGAFLMQKEIWKDVVGYEGLYKVSDMGRVKSFHKGQEKIIVPRSNGNGYYKISLYKNKRKQDKYIHRLVFETFIGIVKEVDHKDMNRANNILSNLRRCSRTFNNGNRRPQKNKKSICSRIWWTL